MNEGNLNHYRKNLYSQSGEDGILEEIFRRLEIKEGWFVEFGAWDGRHLSNSYHLLADWNWRGVFIEGDPKKYEALLQTRAQFPERLHTICAMVGFEGQLRLDNLLSTTPIAKDFEMLSIDIDSFDWQVWNAVEIYRPKVVVIECNTQIPPGVVSVHAPPDHQGASFTAVVELGKRKGYQLVCHTGNCIFVLNELVPALHMDATLLAEPDTLFDYRAHRKEKLIQVARKCLPEKLLHVAFGLSGRVKERLKEARRRKQAAGIL